MKYVLIFLVMFSSNWAVAANNGHNLLKGCNAAIALAHNSKEKTYLSDNNDRLLIGFCAGLIEGIWKLNTLYASPEYRKNPQPFFCLPGDKSLQDAWVVVVNFLNENPEHLNEEAFSVALLALLRGYPC